MHYDKKKLLPPGPIGGKQPVLGMRERETGRVIAYPIDDIGVYNLSGNILENVEQGSTIYTDEHGGYNYLNEWYNHSTVAHTKGQYQEGRTHTNGIESIWAVLKRGYRGVYHYWSKKHMERYVNEFVFRLNAGGNDVPIMKRMELLIRNAFNKRLTYEELTAE